MAAKTESEIKQLVSDIFAQIKAMKMEAGNLSEEKKKKDFSGNLKENAGFVTVFGAELTEKPEHMTHLRGNFLVFKDHPRIAFRGRIDSLEAEILQVQQTAHTKGKQRLVQDLQEILDFVRNLIRCEVLEEEVGEFHLQGLDAKDLREQSHHPSKYFGKGHFLPEYSMGEIVIGLNKLRTKTRETELIAYQAFKDEFGAVSRPGMIKALNRLSSLFWIMMFKELTGKYNE